jgi:hypothetical protein
MHIYNPLCFFGETDKAGALIQIFPCQVGINGTVSVLRLVAVV